MSLETTLQPSYGPRFYTANGEDYFVHQIDARGCIGPRLATDADKKLHPKLWNRYQAALAAEADAGEIGNAPAPAPKAKAKKKGK